MVATCLVLGASATLINRAGAADGAVHVGHAGFVPIGASRLGTLSSGTALELEITLQPRDPAGLAALAVAVSTPGSASYHEYLSPDTYDADFAPSEDSVHTVTSVLTSEGLTVAGVAPGNAGIYVRATAARVERAFGISLERYRLATGRTGFVNPAAPSLPDDIASDVAEVIGLDSLGAASPADQRAPLSTSRSAAQPGEAESTAVSEHNITAAHLVAHDSGPQPSGSCASAIASGASSENATFLTQAEIAEAYGYTDLYGANDLGEGSTIALIEFAPYLASDISAFESCFSTPPSPTINVIPVDGGAGTASTGGFGVDEGGQEEAEIDLEQVIALAPDATIDVYEAPEVASDTGTLDADTSAIDNPAVQVISTSWGACEAATDASLANSESTLFEQAAVEGKSIVAATGDEGSEDCDGELRGSAGAALAVDDPASQPYVTGVGGTTLTAVGPPPSEVVWDSSADGGLQGGAGGGGVSSLWQMPAYQADSAGSLGVVTANSACSSGSGNCREVPDVAADAGAVVAFYCTETGREGCESGGWTGFGGTSVAAPTWAALVALADVSTSCGASPIGFANPALYAVAGGPHASAAFNDITSGDNDLLGNHNGSFAAGPGYDMASGLGTPIAGTGTGTDEGLVSQLCGLARASDFPAPASATTTTSTTTTTTTVPVTSTSTTTTLAPAPTIPAITKITPKAGPKNGSTKVTITGSRFTKVTAVRFGTKKALSFTVKSTTKIVAISPPGMATVSVRVTTKAGAAPAVAAARFTYLAAPLVLAISPSSGPAVGGTKAVVRGKYFSEVSAVRFGARKAESFRVQSSTTIVATTPAGSKAVDVTVTTPGGTGGLQRGLAFHYR